MRRRSTRRSTRRRVSGTTKGGSMSWVTGVEARSSNGTRNTSFTCTTPRTSSRSAPTTGKRECPLATERSVSVAPVSSTSTKTTDRRGTSAAAASFVPNRIDRVSSRSALGSSVPSSPELRMSSSSSSSDRTEASSSCGSMPTRRTVQSAAPLRKEMSGPNIRPMSVMGGASAYATRRGRAMASDFGISSPITIDTRVASTSAMPIDTPRVRCSETRSPTSGSMASATVGSAMNPTISDVTVMPSCAPDRWNDRRRSAALVARAPRLPAAASASTRARPTATSANSTATKNPVARMSRKAARRPSAVWMRSVRGRGEPGRQCTARR